MYNFNNFEPTFNKAIDHCANIIACARKCNQPVKALHLSKGYFDWFKSGVQILIDKSNAENKDELLQQIQEGGTLQFDGVEIHKSLLQTKPVIIEYYQALN